MKTKTRNIVAYSAMIATGAIVGSAVSVASLGLFKNAILKNDNSVIGYFATSILSKTLALVVGLPILAAIAKPLAKWVDSGETEVSTHDTVELIEEA